jgi:regulator of replication initiation timing
MEISKETFIQLIKVQDQVKELERQNRELRMIIEQLQKRIAQARPHMAEHMKPLDGSRATNITEVIDYKYNIK